VQRGQHARPRLDEEHARHARIDQAVVARDHIHGQLLDGAGELDAGRPGADDDEGEVRGTLGRIDLDFRCLERAQQARADEGCLLHGFHAGGELPPLLVTEVVIDGAWREHQVVIAQLAASGAQPPRRQIDLLDLREHHSRVPLVAQDRADRLRDVRRRERRGCHLVEQRLEEMVVVAVDDQHVSGRARQCPRGEQAAETTTDDDDLRSTGPRQHALRSATTSRMWGRLSVAASPRGQPGDPQ